MAGEGSICKTQVNFAFCKTVPHKTRQILRGWQSGMQSCENIRAKNVTKKGSSHKHTQHFEAERTEEKRNIRVL